MLRTGLLLAAVALAAAGPTPPPPAGGPVLAVYPHRLGWDDPTLAAALTEDAVTAARRTGHEVLAPSELHVSDPASRDVLAGSDVARAVAALGPPPRTFVVLRGATERRVTRTVRQATDGRDTRSSMDEETTWQVRVDVLGPEAGAPLVEVRGEATRHGEVPAGAPPPELRQLHARLVGDALAALERSLAHPATPAR